jgi:creatinine amidohydrolase/Fe(II)-dependent formamide hydrolase-like protein
MLHLAPEDVRMARAVDEPDRTIGRVLQYQPPVTTRSGVVGTPSAGSAARGGELHASLVEALAELLSKARGERDPEL